MDIELMSLIGQLMDTCEIVGWSQRDAQASFLGNVDPSVLVGAKATRDQLHLKLLILLSKKLNEKVAE